MMYTFAPNAQIESAIKETQRRLDYDANFLRQCGIAPLPENAFWVEHTRTMHVFVDYDRKRPSLRVFVKETEVVEGRAPAWVRFEKAKVAK